MKKLLILAIVLLSAMQVCASEQLLTDGWRVQSSVTGDSYDAQVPSTIMGTLTRNGLYKGILEGLAYQQYDSKPFKCSWWYRRDFTLTDLGSTEHVLLVFDGICYRANVLVNGRLVASRDTLCGPFRRHVLDITAVAKAMNTLEVEVFPPQPGEPNIGFVDWNPRPLDESMGLQGRHPDANFSEQLRLRGLLHPPFGQERRWRTDCPCLLERQLRQHPTPHRAPDYLCPARASAFPDPLWLEPFII